MERDRFMSPATAREFGLIDKILEQPPKYLGKEDEIGHGNLTTPTSSSKNDDKHSNTSKITV